MPGVRDPERAYPSDALGALFSPAERWGWSLDAPREFSPSALRNAPPIPAGGEAYAVTYQRWRERIELEEQVSLAGASTLATWSAQRPAGEYSMAAVFGGTTIGWHALLTTLGGSILGSGSMLTVINLSERAVAASLRTVARQCGYRIRMDTVAPEKSSLDLFAFAGRDQLIDFIVDVLHHDEAQPTGEPREDRALLRAVASALRGEVTCVRLQAALRVLLRESTPPGPGDPLGAEEYQRISVLFGEQRRQYTDVVARGARLEHALEDFVSLERSGRLAAPESARDPEDLRIVEAWRTPNRLDFDLSVRLLIEATLRRLTARVGSGGRRQVYAVVGADRLNRRLIDSLSDLADGGEVALVLLFAHLRDDALDALGSARSAIAFMRLTDHREADQASAFIGTEHRFVVSQTTRTRGENYEYSRGHNTGRERSRSDSRGPDFGRTIGQSVGQSEGTSTTSSRGESFTASETDQRVEEPIAERHVLQSLPETGLLLVDLHTRVPVFADCDPTIVTFPALG